MKKKYSWIIIIGFILITILIGKNIPKNIIDADVTNYVPKTINSKINTDYINELFGASEILMIVLSSDDIINESSLTRLKKVSLELKKDKNIDKILSLFELKEISGKEDYMSVNPAILKIPKTPIEKESLKKKLINNEIVYGKVISKDFSKTAIILILKDNSNNETLLKKIDNVFLKYPGDEDILIGGLPFILNELPKMIQKDMKTLMPIAIILMLIMLFYFFRRIKGMLLPFSVVLISIIICFGTLPIFGWKLTLVSILVPIMLIAVANDYGIHVIAKYQELNTVDSKLSSIEIVSITISSLWKPILITGITTVIGLLSLLWHEMIPSKQVGVILSIGITYALLASLLFIPAILSLSKKEKPLYNNSKDKKYIMDKLLTKISHLVTVYSKKIIIVTLFISICFGSGLAFLGLDANPFSYFKKDNPIKIADNTLNKNFGGSQQFSILFQGDIKDPKILNKMDYYVSEIKKIKEVGDITSISEMIKEMSKALNGIEDPLYDKIPKTREAVAQYLEMYMMSGDPDDFEKLVDFDYKNAQIIIRVNDASTSNINMINNKINELKKDDKSIKTGGFSLILTETGKIMIKGQVSSMIAAFISIFIIISLLFKSIKAGVLGVIPLFISITILFGFMGLSGMKINIASAMLSSILIGIGIDYTVHFLWRYKSELKRNKYNYQKAVTKTIETTGRGIIFNALSVMIGFIALMTSDFVPIIQFGYLVVFSVFTCLVGSIILVPSICLIYKPKFLEI